MLLATEGLQLRSGTHKLTGRYIGPFRVVGSVNDNAVTLELPPLLGALHPTFNISRLKLYRDGRALLPGPAAAAAAAAGGGARTPTAWPATRWSACWRSAAAGAATRAAGALEGLRRRARRVAAAQRAGAHRARSRWPSSTRCSSDGAQHAAQLAQLLSAAARCAAH